MSFEQLGVSKAIVDALEAQQIREPMPIQVKAIPELLNGVDGYVSAETGMGKTLAYLLPLFGLIDGSSVHVQAMILAPTHELASQIHQEFLKLSQATGGAVKSVLLIGGANPKRQIDKLKKKPQVVIGSVGRILELQQMKKLKVQQIKVLVVDEADRMLYGDKLLGVQHVIKMLPVNRQLIFVSATLQTNSYEAAIQVSPSLKQLSVAENQVNRNIEHLYFVADRRTKADLLRKVVRAVEPAQVIVFVHRNKDAELLRSKMDHYQISVVDLCGIKDKQKRKKAIDDFRRQKVQVMIASDVAARGLDIKGVNYIINYDIPAQPKDYLHRAGRTGRAGAHGYAFSLITEPECRLIKRLEDAFEIKMLQAEMKEGEILVVV